MPDRPKPEVAVNVNTEPALPSPVARNPRISEPGCHDFGELWKD